MKRKLLSYLTTSIAAVGLVLAILGQYKAGMYVACLGVISSIISVKKVTGFTDGYMSVINAGLLGFCLSPGFETFPYFLAACLSFALAGFMRLSLASKIGNYSAMWVEPLLTLAGIGFYVTGNLLTPAGWQGWALPAVLLIFFVFLTLSHLVDYWKMKGITGNATGFNVEIGKPAPDFSLPDHQGNLTTLSEYSRQRKNVLLIFVRGDWCPSCHIMLRTYQRNKEKFGQKNITIMAIGPDPVGVNRQMVESLNVDYKILSDDAFECSRKYGIRKAPNNIETNYAEGIPLPASFLVCQDGILRYTSRADKPGEILNPAEIFSVLDQLN